MRRRETTLYDKFSNLIRLDKNLFTENIFLFSVNKRAIVYLHR